MEKKKETNENKHYPNECPECHMIREFTRIYGKIPTPQELGIDVFGRSCRCEEIHKNKLNQS